MKCEIIACFSVCVHEEAEKVCGDSVAPYMPSILDVLTEHISEGIQGMQHTLRTQMDSALTQTTGGKAGVEKVREMFVWWTYLYCACLPFEKWD